MERLSLSLQLDTEKQMSRDDYIAAEEELSSAEEQQAQEEAHHHFVSVEFSVSINPKPVISLLIESSFSDVIFFSPICTDAGHAGFRLSIP